MTHFSKWEDLISGGVNNEIKEYQEDEVSEESSESRAKMHQKEKMLNMNSSKSSSFDTGSELSRRVRGP